MRHLHRGRGLLILALGAVQCLSAQIAALPAIAQEPPYAPLTREQKFTFSLHKVFGSPGLLAVTLHAGFEQATKQTSNWGTGSDAFGVRFASCFGRRLVWQNIAFGVGAVDHEDPRYFRLGEGTMWKRTRYAMVHALVARSDGGTSMPAYSRLLADYGMPFIAQRWQPARFQTVSAGLRDGTLAIGIGALANIGREFWPDIRKRLLATHMGARYSTMVARHGAIIIPGASGQH